MPINRHFIQDFLDATEQDLMAGNHQIVIKRAKEELSRDAPLGRKFHLTAHVRDMAAAEHEAGHADNAHSYIEVAQLGVEQLGATGEQTGMTRRVAEVSQKIATAERHHTIVGS